MFNAATETQMLTNDKIRLIQLADNTAKEFAALRAENQRLREALDQVCERLHDDAVNGHLLPAQSITLDGIGEVYEVARAALKGAE